jgi:TonB family protein
MKAVNKFAVLLSLGALVPAAFATTDEQAYLESCLKAPGVPVPVAVVSPTVGPDQAGGFVELEFVVDETGLPTHFAVKNATDDALASTVLRAVKQWRFKPAEVDGVAVAKKVVLPIKIVEGALYGPSLAMK